MLPFFIIVLLIYIVMLVVIYNIASEKRFIVYTFLLAVMTITFLTVVTSNGTVKTTTEETYDLVNEERILNCMREAENKYEVSYLDDEEIKTITIDEHVIKKTTESKSYLSIQSKEVTYFFGIIKEEPVGGIIIYFNEKSLDDSY